MLCCFKRVVQISSDWSGGSPKGLGSYSWSDQADWKKRTWCHHQRGGGLKHWPRKTEIPRGLETTDKIIGRFKRWKRRWQRPVTSIQILRYLRSEYIFYTRDCQLAIFVNLTEYFRQCNYFCKMLNNVGF